MDKLYSFLSILFSFILLMISIVCIIIILTAIPLFFILLILKLCVVIDWNWFYIWLPLLLFAGALLFAAFVDTMLDIIAGEN